MNTKLLLALFVAGAGAYYLYRSHRNRHEIAPVHHMLHDDQWKARLIEFFLAEDVEAAFETFRYLVDNNFSEARAFDIVVHNRG